MAEPSSLMLSRAFLQCKACKLVDTRLRVVPGYGCWPSPVMFVGQSPGYNEDRQGRPFIGRAGEVLQQLCKAVGWDLDALFRHNVVACHPPNDRPTTVKENRACEPWLLETIRQVDPDVLIALGDPAAKALLGGKKQAITAIRGLVFQREIAGRTRTVIPTLHPAFVARSKRVRFSLVVGDLQKAKSLVNSRLTASDGILGNTPSLSMAFNPHKAELVDIIKLFQQAKEQNLPIGFDLETEGLERDSDIDGVGVSIEPGQGYYYPALDAPAAAHAIQEIGLFLEDEALKKVIHNVSFERHILANYGINLRGTEDTMLQLWLRGDQPTLGLKAATHRLTGHETAEIDELITKEVEGKKGKKKKQKRTMRQAQLEEEDRVVAYSSADPDAALRLHLDNIPWLHKVGTFDLYDGLERRFAEAIFRMETNGIKLDAARLVKPRTELLHSLQDLRVALAERASRDFNPNSSDQCAELLYDSMQLIPYPHKVKGKHPPTDKVSLAPFIGNDLVRGILSYRAQYKLLTTYVDKLPLLVADDGRIHCRFNQTGAATGRVSSSEPNMQNIPSRSREDVEVPVAGGLLRAAFVSERGWFLLAPDLSQIELRVCAHLSQDQAMIDALSHSDLHALTAERLFGVTQEETEPLIWKNMRYLAKMIRFGTLYGLTPEGLLLRTPTLNLSLVDADRFIRETYAATPGVRPWQERLLQECRRNGYLVSILGRRRYFPEINSENRMLREAAEREAINFPVQGGAADVFKTGVVAVMDELDRRHLRTKLILQVHDELVMEGPFEELDEVATEVCPLLATALPLSLPVQADVEYGFDWYHLTNYDPNN